MSLETDSIGTDCETKVRFIIMVLYPPTNPSLLYAWSFCLGRRV